jgi:hypothetical protein
VCRFFPVVPSLTSADGSITQVGRRSQNVRKDGALFSLAFLFFPSLPLLLPALNHSLPLPHRLDQHRRPNARQRSSRLRWGVEARSQRREGVEQGGPGPEGQGFEVDGRFCGRYKASCASLLLIAAGVVADLRLTFLLVPCSLQVRREYGTDFPGSSSFIYPTHDILTPSLPFTSLPTLADLTALLVRLLRSVYPLLACIDLSLVSQPPKFKNAGSKHGFGYGAAEGRFLFPPLLASLVLTFTTKNLEPVSAEFRRLSSRYSNSSLLSAAEEGTSTSATAIQQPPPASPRSFVSAFMKGERRPLLERREPTGMSTDSMVVLADYMAKPSLPLPLVIAHQLGLYFASYGCFFLLLPPADCDVFRTGANGGTSSSRSDPPVTTPSSTHLTVSSTASRPAKGWHRPASRRFTESTSSSARRSSSSPFRSFSLS